MPLWKIKFKMQIRNQDILIDWRCWRCGHGSIWYHFWSKNYRSTRTPSLPKRMSLHLHRKCTKKIYSNAVDFIASGNLWFLPHACAWCSQRVFIFQSILVLSLFPKKRSNISHRNNISHVISKLEKVCIHFSLIPKSSILKTSKCIAAAAAATEVITLVLSFLLARSLTFWLSFWVSVSVSVCLFGAAFCCCTQKRWSVVTDKMYNTTTGWTHQCCVSVCWLYACKLCTKDGWSGSEQLWEHVPNGSMRWKMVQ